MQGSVFIDNILTATAFLLPWIICYIAIRYHGSNHKVSSAVICILLVYAALLLNVHIIDIQIEKELYAFDTNHDGSFSGAEISPAMEKAMEEYTHDTGRAMAPITGAIFALVYTLIVFSFWFSSVRVWREFRIAKKSN